MCGMKRTLSYRCTTCNINFISRGLRQTLPYHKRLLLEAWHSTLDPSVGNDHFVLSEVYKGIARAWITWWRAQASCLAYDNDFRFHIIDEGLRLGQNVTRKPFSILHIFLPTCGLICGTQRTLSKKCTTCSFDFICRGLRQTCNSQHVSTCVHFDSSEVSVGTITSEIHHVAKKDSMSIFFRYRRPDNLNRVGATIVSIHPWNITRNYTTKKISIDAIVKHKALLLKKEHH